MLRDLTVRTVGTLGLALIAMTQVANADLSTFSDQPTFEASLTGGFTLVNLDAQPLSSFAAPFSVEDARPAAAFAQLGIDFQTFNAQVVDGQAIQISVPGRDRLILKESTARLGVIS